MVERLSLEPEHKEQKLKELTPWLAGLLEIGGSMHFQVFRHTYATPRIAFNSDRQSEVKFLEQNLGGKQYPNPKSGNTFKWEVRGLEAVEIAQAIKPFSTSRREHITAFENWENADREERLEIAEDLSTFNRNPSSPSSSPSEYRLEPAVVGGILDSRGILSSVEALSQKKNHGWVFPRIKVSSPNKSLLEALSQKFGGRLNLKVPAGTKLEIKGKQCVIRCDCYEWEIRNQEKLVHFLKEIEPHVIFMHQEMEEALEAIGTA